MTTKTGRQNTVSRQQIADALASVGITSKFKWRKDGVIEIEMTPAEKNALPDKWIDTLESTMNALPGVVKPYEISQRSYSRLITIRESWYTFDGLRWYRTLDNIQRMGLQLGHRVKEITTQEQVDTLLAELTQSLNEWVKLQHPTTDAPQSENRLT